MENFHSTLLGEPFVKSVIIVLFSFPSYLSRSFEKAADCVTAAFLSGYRPLAHILCSILL